MRHLDSMLNRVPLTIDLTKGPKQCYPKKSHKSLDSPVSRADTWNPTATGILHKRMRWKYNIGARTAVSKPSSYQSHAQNTAPAYMTTGVRD